MEERIIKRLPDRDSSYVSRRLASCRGCGHNPPRRQPPLCSQPFTTGAGASWPSHRAAETSGIHKQRQTNHSGQLPLNTATHLRKRREHIVTASPSQRHWLAVLKSCSSDLQMLPNSHLISARDFWLTIRIMAAWLIIIHWSSWNAK